MANAHQWRFFRAGGFDQVQIDSGADLLALKNLDQKLWVALGCPTRGLEFDSKTLDWIDADADTHVRAQEILQAIEWSARLLKNPDLLVKAQDQLRLDDIETATTEGGQIFASARHILDSLGKLQATTICLADVLEMESRMSKLLFNGDGIITPDNIDDLVLRDQLHLIIQSVGSVADLSGQPGINQALCDQFFNEAQAWQDWQAGADRQICLLAENTAAAAAVLANVKAKINDYFTRCLLAAYDARASEPLNRKAEDYAALAPALLSNSSEEIAAFPLAKIIADQALPLFKGINPVWQQRMQEFERCVVEPVLGKQDELTREQWLDLCARFEAFEAWQRAKPVSLVEKLPQEQLLVLLNSDCRQTLQQLLAQDLAVAAEVQDIHRVEKLLRYLRDLYPLVNNFVSFRDFYSSQNKAIFQIGTLYLDGRSCELCVRIDDISKHAALANSSGICLAYCECTRGSQKMTIAAAFTAGDSDYLTVGRNGVFYDRKGQDWDATIVRILDHPISLRQAFWLPYKKLVALISEQLQKFVSAKSVAVDEKLAKASDQMVAPVADGAAKPDKPTPFDIGKFAGIFAAIGLAFAAIGGMVTSIVTGILALAIWQIPLAFLGLILVISGPSVLLAWFKLKRRNLAPILDANGWAINSRARINIAFGTSLTALAQLPTGASRSLVDPYADKKSIFPWVFLFCAVLALMAWHFSWFK